MIYPTKIIQKTFPYRGLDIFYIHIAKLHEDEELNPELSKFNYSNRKESKADTDEKMKYMKNERPSNSIK